MRPRVTNEALALLPSDAVSVIALFVFSGVLTAWLFATGAWFAATTAIETVAGALWAVPSGPIREAVHTAETRLRARRLVHRVEEHLVHVAPAPGLAGLPVAYLPPR